MLRLTILKNENFSFLKQFKNIFNKDITPSLLKKDIWDFGDKLIIGNKTTNEILSYEAIARNSINAKINDTTTLDIYIDIFSNSDIIGYGPCEKQYKSIYRYENDNFILEIDDDKEELCIAIINPDDIHIIYENIMHLIKDSNLSLDNYSSKYDWIGKEKEYIRAPNSKNSKVQYKLKKEILSKTPRIPLVIPNNNTHMKVRSSKTR
jgi:hypothetical protein